MQGELHRGHDVGLEEEGLGVEEGYGDLLGTIGGDAAQLSAVGADEEDVTPTLAVGGEGDLSAVGAPDGGAIVGGIGGQTQGTPSLGRHGIDITAVAEGDAAAVGADLLMAQPEWALGALGAQATEGAQRQAADEGQWDELLHSLVCMRIVN